MAAAFSLYRSPSRTHTHTHTHSHTYSLSRDVLLAVRNERNDILAYDGVWVTRYKEMEARYRSAHETAERAIRPSLS